MTTNVKLISHRQKFGQLILSKRRQMKLSLSELAELLNKQREVRVAYPQGMHKQSIHTWEAGRSYPPRTIDAALCRVLAIDPEQLVIGV